MNRIGATPSQPNASDPLFPGFPTLDVGRLITVVRKRIWLAAMIAGIFVGLAVLYVLTATKIYESSAVIHIGQTGSAASNPGIRGASAASWETLDALKSMAAGITNGAVILRVVDKLNLREDPDFLKPQDGGYSDSELVEIIGRSVSSELVRGTRDIFIRVKDRSPERARDMTQAFIDEFQVLIQEQNVENSERTRKLLQIEAEEQLKRVTQAEEKVQAFREKHADVPLEEEGGLANARLADLDALLSKAATDVIERKAEFDQLALVSDDDPEAILDIGSESNQDHIQKLLLARDEKKASFFRIEQQYEPGHPTYESYKGDLEGLNNEVRNVALKVAETIRKNYERAVAREKDLSQTVAEQKRTLLGVESFRNQFRALKRSVDAAYATYQRLLDKMNETDASDGFDETVVRVFSPPMVPVKPVSPKKKVVVGIAGFFGSFVGLAVVLGIGLMDRKLHSRKQVESTLGLSVLAEIPRAFQKNWDLKDSLFVTKDPNSLVSEGFRALRTSLSSHSPRSVMVCSASPGEGKSFCAANLALLQAHFGYRTLLVDADFRKPRMAEVFTDPLRGSTGGAALATQNLCQETMYKNLFLLSCGRFTSTTGEPMNGEIFASMLWEAYSSFDCVIIDTSPLAVVSDGLTYARHADAVALVIESGETEASVAKHVASELRRMRAPLIGCILNGVAETNKVQQDYMQTAVRQASITSTPARNPAPTGATY